MSHGRAKESDDWTLALVQPINCGPLDYMLHDALARIINWVGRAHTHRYYTIRLHIHIEGPNCVIANSIW